MDPYWECCHMGRKANIKSISFYQTRGSAMRKAREIMKQPGELGDFLSVDYYVGTDYVGWDMTPTGWIKR